MPDLRLPGEASAPASSYRRSMDVASIIMGMAIASIAWICFVPWTKLRELREAEARAAAEGRESDPT